jgi:signal transduction histidine kinase/ligand-binding sensor domain-containing protein
MKHLRQVLYNLFSRQGNRCENIHLIAKKSCSGYIFVLLLALIHFTSAQSYRVISYGVEDGLPTDLIKATYKDDLGFIWIATDNGLVRFDGIQFHRVQKKLPSLNTKTLLKRTNNQVLAVTDLGLVEVISKPDFIDIIPEVAGSENKSDSTIWYPKNIYEDTHQNLWIIEPDAIVRVIGSSIKRYSFDLKDHSYDFLRSFNMVEDGFGNLIVISLPGYIFYYDIELDTFIEISSHIRIPKISTAINIGPGRIWMGSDSGVFELQLDEQHQIKQIITLNKKIDASWLLKTNSNEILIGSWSHGLIKATIAENEYVFSKVVEFPFKKVNHIFQSGTDIWISTDTGICLLQPMEFRTVLPELYNTYVHCIDEDSKGNIYFSNGNEIVSLDEAADGTFQYRSIYNSPDEIALQVRFNDWGLWISNSKGQVLFQGEKTNRIFDLLHLGIAILFIMPDDQGNIWVCQDNMRGLSKITPEFNVIQYQAEKGITDEISVIRQSATGRIFCGGQSETTYLYQYDENSDSFRNISRPLPFTSDVKLIVNDIMIDDHDVVWIGTSTGLLRYENHKIKRVDLGAFTGEAVQALAIDHTGNKWIAITQGLVEMTDTTWVLLDVKNGLSSKTISSRGIFVDHQNRIWVGTAVGISVSETVGPFKITPVPVFLSVEADGRRINIEQIENSTFTKDTDFRLDFVSLSYPGNELQYQTRILGFQDQWTNPINYQQYHLPRISTGKFVFQARAKQSGNYVWSSPISLPLNIRRFWYETWWAISLYALGIIAIIIAYNKYNTWKLVQEKDYLEKVVRERTTEIRAKNKQLEQQKEKLEQLNKELSKTNAEKDRFFSILAHDLKNPFNALLGISDMLVHKTDRLNADEIQEYLQVIYDASHQTFNLLENLLQWSRSETGRIEWEPKEIDLSKSIIETISLLSGEAKIKAINVTFTAYNNNKVFADENMTKTVLRNLISNAIKFTPPNGKVVISTRLIDTSVEVSVIDTGVGIIKENINKLFRIDVHHSTLGTNDERGTGVGLMLCKEFVEKNGDTIRVESQPEEGSTFTFTLPVGK